MTFGFVGVALGDEHFDHLHHLRNVAGAGWFHIGRQHPKGSNVFVELLRGPGRHRGHRFVQLKVWILLSRARVDLVIHIRDVAHIFDMPHPIHMPQQTVEHIEYDHRARIADVGVAVDRRPAGIHAHVLRIYRGEGLFLARQSVVEFQFHLSHIFPRIQTGNSCRRLERSIRILKKERPSQRVSAS